MDATVAGVRGVHRVDVLAVGAAHGLDLTWIVECKHWNRRVDKAPVLTLQGIVEDVGADRGVLLSERGFQAGAHAAARQSNVTLTSLETLRTDTTDALLDVRWNTLYTRWLTWKNTKEDGLTRFEDGHLVISGAVPWPEQVSWNNRGRALDYGLEDAKAGRFPAVYDCATDWNADTMTHSHAGTMVEFLTRAERVMGELEDWLDSKRPLFWPT